MYSNFFWGPVWCSMVGHRPFHCQYIVGRRLGSEQSEKQEPVGVKGKGRPDSRPKPPEVSHHKRQVTRKK